MVAGPPLKCTTVDDVYLLLKSSDFVTHDLDHAYDDCEDAAQGEARSSEYQLVLKKWFAMPKSHEFRCFVRDRRLIGRLRSLLVLASFAKLNHSILARLLLSDQLSRSGTPITTTS